MAPRVRKFDSDVQMYKAVYRTVSAMRSCVADRPDGRVGIAGMQMRFHSERKPLNWLDPGIAEPIGSAVASSDGVDHQGECWIR